MSHFLDYQGLITYTRLLKNYVAQSTSYSTNDFDINNTTGEVSIALLVILVEPSDDTVREEYALVGNDNDPRGETIKVYKNNDVTDLLVKEAGTYYVDSDGLITEDVTNTESVTISSPSIIVVQQLDNGEYTIDATVLPVSVDAKYIGDGLQINDNIISILLDDSSEENDGSQYYLSVSSDGLKLDGINDAIANAVAEETEQRLESEQNLQDSITELLETATNHVAREDTSESTDLDIVDPNDNVIVRFASGLILTAAFNSLYVLSLIEEILERLNALEVKLDGI